jgi:hypothetical protein
LNKHLDNIPDGATYGRPVVSRLNAGRPVIDFSEGIHSNQNLDHIADGTRAAWDSGTMKNAAVDSAGNIKLKNVNDAVGSTAGPSTSSTTYAVVPEMTQTLTFKGNKVLLVFTCSCKIFGSTVQSGNFAFFKDGVQLSQDYTLSDGFVVGGAVITQVVQLVGVTFIDAPSAGSHTYDVRFCVGNTSWTLQCTGYARRFQIVELG